MSGEFPWSMSDFKPGDFFKVRPFSGLIRVFQVLERLKSPGTGFNARPVFCTPSKETHGCVAKEKRKALRKISPHYETGGEF